MRNTVRYCAVALLAIVMMSGIASLALAETHGIWEQRAYVDEFNMPTDDYYISNADPIIGTFSNSATTNSQLKVYLFIDDNYVSIRLIEYGSNIVKNSSSKTKTYNTIMMDTNGERHYFDGYMSSGYSDVFYLSEQSNLIIDSLRENGTVRFAITDESYSTTKYIFAIDDTTGFNDYFVETWEDIGSFSEGLLQVEKAKNSYGFKQIGLIDASGSLVVPCEWDYISAFSEGFAAVRQYVNGNIVMGFIDKTGHVVSPCEWEFVTTFRDGLAAVLKDGKYGYINTSGELVIPCQWDYAGWFSEGLAEVRLGEQYGVIDTEGNVVIPYEWDWIDSSFSEGLTAVKKEDKYGFINMQGDVVIPCEWDFAYHFSNDLACVKQDGKVGFINMMGQVVIPCEWDSSSAYFHEGLTGVKIDERWGYINQAGEVVIEPEWDSVGSFSDGMAYVVKDEQYGFINKEGEIVIPCQWDHTRPFSDGYSRVKKTKSMVLLIA